MPMYRFSLVQNGHVVGTQDGEFNDDDSARSEAYDHPVTDGWVQVEHVDMETGEGRVL